MLELESLTTPKPFNRPAISFPAYNPPAALRGIITIGKDHRATTLYYTFSRNKLPIY